MTPHQDFAIAEASQVGAARRAAARLAADHGYDEVACGRIGIVVTELGNNLARHATGGRLLVATHRGENDCIDVLAIDGGPGMPDVERCLTDGYSTAGTPGTGLGAVRRLSDEFSIFSQVDRGTVVFGRIAATGTSSAASRNADRFQVGAVCLAAPGEAVSGDAWDFVSDGARAALMVADGLGHGPHAAEAAGAALSVFAAQHDLGPAQVLGLAHDALRSTRGAAVAMAVLDADAGEVRFAGAGNIAGRLISGVEDRSLLSQHGTVGLQIRRLQDVTYGWGDHAILVLHSDGVVTRWSLAQAAGLLACHPSVIAGWVVRDHVRGRDDVTVVVLKRR